tara:strand:+ start:6393 stop:8459 length:2067 start_codon:yes stop_codon:yes gene_type:complete
MKTRIRSQVSGSNPRDLGRLAKSARFVGLTDDSEVETDIDTEMAAAIPSASVDDLVEMSEGLKELRTGAADMGSVANTDNLTEGGNKFLNAESVQPQISVSGDLSYNGGVVSYTAPTAAALQVVATVGDLPAGASAGDQAVVQSNNKLYIKTADGWYAVALINTAPTVSGNDAAYTLATDMTPTVITLTATDPENDPVSFSHAVTSGALNGTTVTQNDNVFTITPHGVLPATFELTFSANDSVNVATTTPSSFTLAFSTDWAAFSSWNTTQIINPNPGWQTWTSASDGHKFGSSVAISENYFVVGSGDRFQFGYRGGRHYLYDMTGSLLHTLDWGAAAYFTSPSGIGASSDDLWINNGFFRCQIHEGRNVVATLSDRRVSANTRRSHIDFFDITSGNLISTFIYTGDTYANNKKMVFSDDGNTLYLATSYSRGIHTIDITNLSSPTLTGTFVSKGGSGLGSLGRGLDIKNNWVVFGEDGADYGGQNEAGRAWVKNTVNNTEYEINPTSPAGYGNFGFNTLINDNWIAISETGGESARGVVYLYEFDSTDDNAAAPVIRGRLTPNDFNLPIAWGGSSYQFGNGVEMTDEALFVVGGRQEGSYSQISVFNLNNIPAGGSANSNLSSSYMSTMSLDSPTSPEQDYFANSQLVGYTRHNFAVDGTTLIAGSPGYQQGSYDYSGTAYLFKATT